MNLISPMASLSDGPNSRVGLLLKADNFSFSPANPSRP